MKCLNTNNKIISIHSTLFMGNRIFSYGEFFRQNNNSFYTKDWITKLSIK